MLDRVHEVVVQGRLVEPGRVPDVEIDRPQRQRDERVGEELQPVDRLDAQDRGEKRPGETEPQTSRAELRYPPGAYYRRIVLGTVLPGAGLLGTRWKVLGWVLVLASLAAGTWVLVKAWQGGLLRSALNVAVQPQLLQWVGVGIMVAVTSSGRKSIVEVDEKRS